MSHSGHILLALCALRGVAALTVPGPSDVHQLLQKTTEGNPVRQTLRSDEGMAYYGTIKIGGQAQQAIYDTGSFDLVLASQCAANEESGSAKATCCSSSKCPKAAYSTGKSIFWKPVEGELEEIQYGSGPVLVKHGHDQVSLEAQGSGFMNFLQGQIISNDDVPVRVIVDHDVDLFYDSPLQAIVGIGPGEFAEREKRMTTKLGIQRFNVCYQEDPNKDGYITWNDKDRSNDEEWVTVPVLGKTFWATPASDFKLVMPEGRAKPGFTESLNQMLQFGRVNWDKETVVGCNPHCGAVVDTGTSLFTPPPEVVDQIQLAIESKDIQDCSDLSKFPTLAFKLGDKEFTLPPESYIGDAGDQSPENFKNVHLAFPMLPMKSQDLNLVQVGSPVHSCVLLLSDGDETEQTPWGPMMILGMSLFRKYAVQFDLTGDFEGKEPSVSNPTRFMRFAEATPDCTETKAGSRLHQIFNNTQTDLHQIKPLHRMFGSMQKVNLKKLRVSPLQKQLKQLNKKKKASILLQKKMRVKI